MMYEGMLPQKQIEGKRGYYPVTTAEEWDELPKVYKAMEWFPVKVYNKYLNMNEVTVAEYIEFDVVHMMPYRVNATVKVHVQEVQKILYCAHKNTDCHLYTVCGVVFANGERWNAEWKQDCKSGAFAIYASGKQIGMQGGYMGFIPCKVKQTEDGFEWDFLNEKNRCHVSLVNPFTGK